MLQKLRDRKFYFTFPHSDCGITYINLFVLFDEMSVFTGVDTMELAISEPQMDSFQVQQMHRSTLPVFSRLRLQDEESSGYGTGNFDSLDQV